MKAAWRIAREEWRCMARDRVAVLGLVLLLVLSCTAALTAHERQRTVQAERARYQAQVDEEFQAQPDRHPHRMVHYGQFVFRPLSPLAAFDSGIDGFTGHTLFLEGHRQNSANFGDVRQSSLLQRFGQLTPAFVLQVLAPLLLVFVGHAALAREREAGTLRVLLAQGVSAWAILAGKLLAMAGLAMALLLPAAVALGWIAATQGQAQAAALLLAGHALWLLLWSTAIVLVSGALQRRRDALLGLLALWTVTVILLPRLLPEAAQVAKPLPTRLETDIAVARELAALGDSHNPDDPYFASFRQKILAQYGVARVEDLRVNYKGIVGMEGERLTSALFDRHAEAAFRLQAEQGALVATWGIASPIVALRTLSMAAAGTDLASYKRFLDQGEAYRYGLVQSLNRLQAEQLRYADDRNPTRNNRVDRALWQGFPAFHYQAEPTADMRSRALRPALVLLLWAAALAALLPLLANHLRKGTR
ncbi:DUF3526 domain-containing protein [Pseudorhodoferax sp. Leaf267]|uniref:ABC transporter permease n=1 Tax=Pseudorhodoferax sp. Leaf267 TaxID=1736316 RepID=UPI0006F4BDFA|nr:DUF3526 domain-containing protein [Pseudorhodoferax sp. Leaf267]KQP22930.1 ABC transporter permease [Pseudorhodoferax sp. Leaf267]